jgi:radical SAM superfamily enzyme YgiQ (UPF0313 family)
VSRVLLINPWIYDFAAYDLWAKPLGLLCIGSWLCRSGVAVTLIDCLGDTKEARYGTGRYQKQEITKPAVLRDIPRRFCRYGISEESFLHKLASSPKPDVVLITSIMTYWYPGVFRTIELVKNHLPGVPIILGGTYATLCDEHARRLSGADRVFRGRASGDLKSMLKFYITLPDGDEGDALGATPAIDLLEQRKYGVILTSTGCPYRCSYCASHVLCPDFSQRDPGQCFADVLWMRRDLGLKDIAFYDDALLVNAGSHFIPMMDLVCRSALDVRFHTPNGLHARQIDGEVAERLWVSGFKTIRLGVEAITPKSETEMDAKVTYVEMLQAIAFLKKAGFDDTQIGVYLLAGLPGQTREEVEESVWKVRNAGARPYLSEFSPVPGTAIWERACKASPYPIADEPLFHNPTLSPCAPEGASWERVQWRKNILASAGLSHD